MTEPPAMSSSPFLFITGLHRSGTTLARDLIAQHPAVSTLQNTGVIEDEGQHLQSVAAGSGRVGRPGKFAYRRGSRLTEADAVSIPAAGERICRDWAPYWIGGGELFVEKSPINIVRARFLSSIFPSSRFVFVVRHPVAVSYATQKWTVRPQLSILQLLHHWVRANTVAAFDATLLGSRVMFVHYEDLTRRPAAVMGQIFDFAGLPAHDVAVDEVRASGNHAYLERWRDRSDIRSILGRAPYLPVARDCARFGYHLFDAAEPSGRS